MMYLAYGLIHEQAAVALAVVSHVQRYRKGIVSSCLKIRGAAALGPGGRRSAVSGQNGHILACPAISRHLTRTSLNPEGPSP